MYYMPHNVHRSFKWLLSDYKNISKMYMKYIERHTQYFTSPVFHTQAGYDKTVSYIHGHTCTCTYPP